MDLPEDELNFLRDLVKATRQRTQMVAWVDRDGTRRQTMLNAVDAARLARLASSRGLGTAELLRQAAHIPVAKPGRAAVPTPQEDGAKP